MINSILKALDVLALFSTTEPRLNLATISKRLDLPKSTVHNLLQTLMSRGLIEQLETGDYAVGTALIVLSQSARVNVEFRDRAAPLLRELADASHESIYLTVRDGDCGLYIYAIESRHRLLARSAIGDRVPLHCTGNGKSILAHFSSADLNAFAQRTSLPRFTPATITSLEALSEEIKQIREQGYALDRQEHELQTYCIGAPILDARACAIGACSISGNDPEIITSRLPSLVEHLKYTAQEISRYMGFVPDSISQVNRLFAGRV
jgi:DNA-binding IclR family transcriptional regulator